MEVDREITDSNSKGYDTAPNDSNVTTECRGMAKSGRWWKTVRKERTAALIKVKPLKTAWKNKMKAKADSENVKRLQSEIREKIAAEKAALIEAKKEREKRREENLRKAEIVQVIKDTRKLKRAKKKQLRMIEKRDTN